MRIKFLLPVALFTLLVVLTGCPYESKVPLCCYKTLVDNSLIGNWKKTNPDGTPPDYYSFSRVDDYNYTIIGEKYNSSEKQYEKKSYTGFIATVNDVRFLHFYDNAEGGYKFASFSAYSNSLSLSFIADKWFTVKNDNNDEYTFQFSTSEELTRHVKALMNKVGFYETTEQFYKY